jgi:hypothetical protein
MRGKSSGCCSSPSLRWSSLSRARDLRAGDIHTRAAFALLFTLLLVPPLLPPAGQQVAGPPERARPAPALDFDKALAGMSAKARRKTLRLLAGTLKPKRRYDKPQEAQEFWALKRADSTGRVPVGRYLRVREQMKRMPGGSLGPPLPQRLQKALRLTGTGAPTAGSSAPVAPGDPGGPVAPVPPPPIIGPPRLTGWTSLGPGNIGGRTRALVVLPGNVIYAGGVAGGVWKSTDDGASWTALTDFLANLAVSTLAVDPADANRLYAGTGEGYFNGDAVRGAGIFVTSNGGTNWSQLASTSNSNFYYVNKVVVSENSSSVLYAATRSGVFRSTDQGTSWTNQLAGNALEMAVLKNGATDNIFVWLESNTVYRSTDGGATFTPSGSGIVASQWRGSLAVPSSTRAYCAVSDLSGLLVGFYESVDNGATWTQKATLNTTAQGKLNSLLFSNTIYGLDLDNNLTNDCPGYPLSVYSQGWYDNVIAVHPSNVNRIWLGGVDLWRSDNRGVDWGFASYWWKAAPDPKYVHADQHAITFHPSYTDGGPNTTVYFGNDGGVHRTTNGTAAVATAAYNSTAACGTGLLPAVNFSSLNNGYGVTQFYHGAVSGSGTTYIGGAQDNGTLKIAASPTWNEINGGDGGYCAIDPGNPSIMYYEYTQLSLRKSTNGGATSVSAISGITESSFNFQFITPFAMDPASALRLWIGGRQAWRSTDGAGTWTSASPANLTATGISAWAVAPAGAGQIVYLASDQGQVFRTANGLAGVPTWTNITSSLPVGFGRYISSIAVHPTLSNQVFVTYSSFGIPGGQVYRTLDASLGGGTVWTSAIGTGTKKIPDVPVHVLIIHPTDPALLFVGTDAGVMASSDDAANWNNISGTTLPNTVVEHLAFQNPDQLFAFTHGRGVFRTTAVPVLISVLVPDGGERVLPGPGPTSSVTWTVNANSSQAASIDSFDVELSKNGGATFTTIASPVGPSTTRGIPWSVDPMDRSVQARVRVRARDAALTLLDEDMSDANFTINSLPVANAGPDQFVVPGGVATLNAASSSDPDIGTVLTYLWTRTAGPPVTLILPTDPTPTFTASSVRGDTHDFQCDVSDGYEVSIDTTRVRINRMPLASAGADQRVPPSVSVTLTAAGSSDPDGQALTYTWTQVTSVPGLGFPQSGSTAVFPAPAERGTLMVFNLEAFDGLEPANDTVSVSVNQLPIANAGPSQRVAPGTVVTLVGSASSDADSDVLTYLWTQTTGPPVTFSMTAADPSFTVPNARGSTLGFELRVSDGVENRFAATSVVINRLPVASASASAYVPPTTTVTLTGAVSDPDSDPLTYLWTQTAGPAVSLTNATAASASFTSPVARSSVLTFNLRVSDGVENVNAAVTVRVNQLPVAIPVPDPGSRVLPSALVTLDGRSSSDPDGATITYLWTQTAGPAVSFTATSPNPQFTAPATRGSSLSFDLRVSDGVEAVSAATTVRVNSVPVSVPRAPVAFAPTGNVTLTGSTSSDPDADPLTYAWKQTGGPSVAFTATAADPTFTGPSSRGDVLTFELTVSDGMETDTATVKTRVNRKPVADAGFDQVVAPAGGRVAMDGRASSDPDADALTYRWTQTGGPGATLDAASATPSFDPSGMARGSLLAFTLAVTDGVEESTSKVTVRVNQAPVAQLASRLQATPDEMAHVGTEQCRDPDGDPLSYMWTQTGGPPVSFERRAKTLTFRAPAIGLTKLAFSLRVTDQVESATSEVVVELGDRTYSSPAGGGGCRAHPGGGPPRADFGVTLLFAWAATLLAGRGLRRMRRMQP